MAAKGCHRRRWSILLPALLFAVLMHVHSGFIDFRPGYEYIYRMNATADVISVGKFLLRAKISYTNIEEFTDSQELLLRVYDFQFTPIGQLDVQGHDFDFSSWFSFVIAKHGVIIRVYHDEDDRNEVVAIKKGIAGLLSAKLHSEDEVRGTSKGGHYSYTTEEVGHEGPHTADYIVFPTAEGKAFKKTRTNFDHQVENAKSSYEKTLHFHDELGTIHKVLVQEDFTAPTKSKPGFDPYFAMRRVEPVQKFSDIEYPEMKALGDAELHFLTRERALFDTNKPLESIKSASVHVSKNVLHSLPVEKNIDVAWEAVRGNLTCMSNQPAKGSPELSTCFFDIVHVLKRLPAEHLDTIAEFYFTNLSSVYPDNAAARHNMLDAYGVLNTYLSQTILLQRVLLAPTLDEDLVQRVLVQVVAMKTPPIQNITTVIEEMAFDSTIGSRKVSMTTCHRAQMALGSVIRKMKENDDAYSKHLTDRMHGMLGIHDPWRYIHKRSTMTEAEQYDHDREKVVLLEALGNARMDHSYDYILSHINATNSPWIKRAGVHALRHYHHEDAADQLLLTALYDDDENVRFEALLQYQAHPKSRIITPLNNRAHPNDSYVFDPYASGIQEVAVHHRDRRSLMNFMKLNLHFHLEAPGVDWRKELGTKDMGASFGIILKNMLDIRIAPLKGHLKVEVHDEAYARAHVGKSNFNIDFFVARLCFTGGAEYNLNIFQDFDPNLGFDLVKQFDALVKNVVGAIKTGIELFRDLISGNFLKDIVNGFVQALEELPNTVAHLRTRAESVVAKLGRLNLEKLPPFIKPLKELVTHVTNLFTDIKNDVMTFYNKIVEVVTIIIPQAAKQVFESIKGIIEGFKNIFKDPKTALGDIGGGIMSIAMSVSQVISAKDQVEESCFFLKDKKPYWMDLTSQIEIIMDMAGTAVKALTEGGKQWADKILDATSDPISQFTGGKVTSALVKNQVVQELLSIADEITTPFKSLTGIGGKFFERLTKLIDLVMKIKDAYNTIKEGYRFARSIIDRIFGPKSHKDFPRETRIQGGGCKGEGFYPSKLDAGSGVKEYQYDGVDLRIYEGDKVVAPFAGIAIRSDSENEVIITNVEKLPKGTEIVITNVYPNSSILHPSEPNYIEKHVASGDPIGTATKSACSGTNHIHFAVKEGEETMDPTRFLEPPFPKMPVWEQKCDDYKLAFMGETIAADCIVCMEGRNENDTTPELENAEDPGLGSVDDEMEPGRDIDHLKSDSNSMYSRLRDSAALPRDTVLAADGSKNLGDELVGGIKTLLNQTAAFFKHFSLRKIKLGSIIEFLDFLHMDESKVKMADVIRTIKDVLDNKPCENPHHMTDDQLVNELSNRGLSSEGSREEQIQRLIKKDGSCPQLSLTMPNQGLLYCSFDELCLGVQCCATVELFEIFALTFRGYIRFDPCQQTLNMGFDKWTKVIDLTALDSGLKDEWKTGIKFNLVGDQELIVRYQIVKKDSQMLATFGAGVCMANDLSQCPVFFNLLEDALLPIPVCRADGTIVWPKVNWSDFLSLEKLKNQLKDTGRQVQQETIKVSVSAALRALGLSEDLLANTPPCPRPENMTEKQLKEKLLERGLSTVGIRHVLDQRYREDDRKCSMFGKNITLPEIGNPSLQKHVYFSIARNCMRLDACLDITIPGVNIIKSFWAYIEMDPCNFVLKVAFERWQKEFILIGYNWGGEEILPISNQISLSFKIDKDDQQKVFHIDFGVQIPSVPAFKIVTNQEIPIPICNENFSLPGAGDIKALAQALNGQLNKEAFNLILKQFGLDKIVGTMKCDLPSVTPVCPNGLNISSVIPRPLEHILRCSLTDNCFGIHCCAEFSFQIPLSLERLNITIPLIFDLDPCQFSLRIVLGTYTYSEQLLTYEWGIFVPNL